MKRYFAAMTLLLLACSGGAQQQATGPKLGVLLVFDQLRAVELDRWAPFFDGGFGGLEARGAARFNAIYSHADTETGPGHATLSTGASPALHGIVSNYWYVDGKQVYATDDPTAPVLSNPLGRGASARYLQAAALADTMKAETRGRARVVTLSLKDRSAILTGGRGADAALWYDQYSGEFTTSRAYGEALPAWAQGLAAELPRRSMASGTWSPLPSPPGLEVLTPPDASPNEEAEVAWKDVFPHDLASLTDPRHKRMAYRLSPHSMEDLFTLGAAALADEALALGRDQVPDLLVMSVSTTDYVGHAYGPDSLEALDLLRRADQQVRGFLRLLDAKLGRGGYVVALSSDHGSTPVPEELQKLGLDAGRISVPRLLQVIEDAAQAAFDRIQPARPPKPRATSPSEINPKLPSRRDAQPASAQPASAQAAESYAPPKLNDRFKFVRGFVAPHVFLDVDALDSAHREAIIAAVRAAVVRVPGIADAYDAAALTDSPFRASYAQLLYPGRNGHVLLRPLPRYTYSNGDETTGTDHGAPYRYDTTVPFWLAGPGVRGGRYAQPCDVRDVAATLAFLLRIPAPDSCEGRPVSAVGAEAWSPQPAGAP